MSDATERLERINVVYAQTIRDQDERIAALEAQLTEERVALGYSRQALQSMANEAERLRAQLAEARERCDALRAGFTACIDTLWRYARTAARERGESETSQLMSANEAVGHFRAALNAAKGE